MNSLLGSVNLYLIAELLRMTVGGCGVLHRFNVAALPRPTKPLVWRPAMSTGLAENGDTPGYHACELPIL